MNLVLKNWNIEEMTGYKPLTTFYKDFSIADMYGEKAINDTYNKIFNEWNGHYKYLTELVMVLNWKIFEHYETNKKYARIYDTLWKKTDEYAWDHLKGEEETYYYRTTD